MTDFAAIVRTEDGESAIEAAVGPSQYGHARLGEIVDAWSARGATPRARTIRRECARAALQLTGENFAQIGRRIQCTRAAISNGVQEFCNAHSIPNRAGRKDDTRRRCQAARMRVLRGEMSAPTPERRDALAGILAALRNVSRRWLAQQCGVTHAAARAWFMAENSRGYRRPVALAESLAKLAKRAHMHPIRVGRPSEKPACRNLLANR